MLVSKEKEPHYLPFEFGGGLVDSWAPLELFGFIMSQKQVAWYHQYVFEDDNRDNGIGKQLFQTYFKWQENDHKTWNENKVLSFIKEKSTRHCWIIKCGNFDRLLNQIFAPLFSCLRQ